jgi:hypothetical protein
MRAFVTAAAAALALAGTVLPATAQETALKAGASVSRLDTHPFWDDPLTATAFGGHIRFRFGRIALQPELLVLTKGANASAALEQEQLRLEYIEVPALVVVPVSIGALEPFVYGGPTLMLESRCRYVIRREGLRSSVGCDPPRPDANIFARNQFDYGLTAGGGASYPLGAGRVMLEARHTWGMRNIQRGAGPEVRNRTVAVLLGYAMGWVPDDGR